MSGIATSLMVSKDTKYPTYDGKAFKNIYQNGEKWDVIPSTSIQDKDKLWLVVYADMRNVPDDIGMEHIHSISKTMKFDGTVETLIIPCYENTHVEVLYDPHSTVDNFQEEINKIKNYIDEYVQNVNKK